MQAGLNLAVSTLWPSAIHDYTCVANNVPLEVGKNVMNVYRVEPRYHRMSQTLKLNEK